MLLHSRVSVGDAKLEPARRCGKQKGGLRRLSIYEELN